MKDNTLYTDNVRIQTPRVRRPSTSEQMEERCRIFNPQPDSDILYDAADHIREQRLLLAQVTRERDAADARVKILEAENITLRALANTPAKENA